MEQLNGVVGSSRRKESAAHAKTIAFVPGNSFESVGHGKTPARCCIHRLSHGHGIQEQTLLGSIWKIPAHVTGGTEENQRHYINGVIRSAGGRKPGTLAKRFVLLTATSLSALGRGNLESAITFIDSSTAMVSRSKRSWTAIGRTQFTSKS